MRGRLTSVNRPYRTLAVSSERTSSIDGCLTGVWACGRLTLDVGGHVKLWKPHLRPGQYVSPRWPIPGVSLGCLTVRIDFCALQRYKRNRFDLFHPENPQIDLPAVVFKQGIVVGTKVGWRSGAENNVTKHPAGRRTIRRAAMHSKPDNPTCGVQISILRRSRVEIEFAPHTLMRREALRGCPWERQAATYTNK